MPGKHTERTFEDAILLSLVTAGGWLNGDAPLDRERALQPPDFFAFLQVTQPEVLAELRKQHGPGTDVAIVDALVKSLESRGTLDVLRNGLKFFGRKLDCAYFKPAHGLNPDILRRYGLNRLVVTRQARFADGENDSVDLLLSLNGLPIATVELKGPLTRQNVHHAIAQYCGRDPRHALFRFKARALVHFAVDADAVYMTTRLAGQDTRFLPFNRGLDGGAGNPSHPGGHRTAYLWQEVLQRDSFLDIIGRLLTVKVKDQDRGREGRPDVEEIVFPRYHQLECVRLLAAAARRDGVGHNYLIQHSAGSGKSNSIAWLAHRLFNLHDEADRKVFDSVVVITDRKVLDRQLQKDIFQIEHRQGVVARIDDDSEQLARELAAGTPIVITTLQKFPFVLQKIGALPRRRYAVIVDEAHSSQGGESAREMKQVLGGGEDGGPAAPEGEPPGEPATEPQDEPLDDEARVLQAVMRSRGRQRNLSFFAFTATPKAKTLEVFGTRDAEGKPRPFHLYSMRQAIEEGFILDVLKSYTTYKAFYRLVKATDDDPRVPKKEATRQLARFMSLHPHSLAQKTAVMVEHFRSSVRHRLGGRAKAMVVTASRLHAVRYRLAFRRYLDEQGYRDLGVLVAFSGTVKDPETEIEHTETGMNVGPGGERISEARLPEAFAGDGFQILIVADKYQTGFDQPLLHTMYVDKRLAGIRAVQTLSRLNRTHPSLRKEDTFVLDFVNEAEEIQRSFQPYYEQTTVAESADPQQLYDLAHKLEGAQVFWRAEVEGFCKVFFSPRAKTTVHDQAEMIRHLNPGVDRYRALPQEEQEAFRNALGAFVRLYAFLSQVMPFSDADLERLYTFCRAFELRLPQDPRKAPLRLDGDVALKYYRLDKIREGAIQLAAGEPGVLYGPQEVGTRSPKDQEAQLSQIIDVLNDRFGTSFGRADEILLDQIVQTAKEDEEMVQRAQANPLDNFALAAKGKLEGLMIDRMEQNQEFVGRLLNDPQFQAIGLPLLIQRIYEEIRARPPAAAP